jgi:hypothetical protein
MIDLTSKPWIVAKGMLFLVMGAVSATLLWLESPTARSAILLALLAWSAARFYYFLFYVLESYVDPSLKYAGIGALVKQILSRTRRR